VVFEGRWCVAASNQTRGGAVQTVLDVWDFAEEGEDWVGEPPGGVYDETDSGGSEDEDEDEEDEEGGGYGYARGGRSMDVDMVLDEDDDAQEQADVDAMDQDLLVPYDDGSGSEHGERDAIRGRATSPEVIEIDEPVPSDSEPDGVRASRWAPPPPQPRAGSSRAAQAGASTRSRRTPAQSAAAASLGIAPGPGPSTSSASTSTSSIGAGASSSTWRRSSQASQPPAAEEAAPRARAGRRGSRR
jgi:F-box and WD-40 domain protein CDC4